ncbi:MAG: hypothetical protein M3066_01350 [Actinomycetota bacterium]|nr:hypothetical protein [Actinomycetota bacterium]
MTRMGHKGAPVVRGSVVVHRRRCGKANCRCAEGVELHESTVLSYSEAGRTKFLMLPPGEVPAVRAAADRYRAAKSAVEEQGNTGLAELIGRLASAKAQRR